MRSSQNNSAYRQYQQHLQPITSLVDDTRVFDRVLAIVQRVLMLAMDHTAWLSVTYLNTVTTTVYANRATRIARLARDALDQALILVTEAASSVLILLCISVKRQRAWTYRKNTATAGFILNGFHLMCKFHQIRKSKNLLWYVILKYRLI